MFEETTAHSPELVNAAQKLISEYFQKPIHFAKVIQLSEPDRRNLILRLMIDQPTTEMPRSIIFKKTVTEKGVFDNKEGETEEKQLSRFAHDWAGLQFLTQIGSNHAPHFYAGNLEHKFILIEDLGVEHPSLVDSLTRSNSSNNIHEAESALLSYVRRLGKMHADTATKQQQFVSILQDIYPQANRLYLPEHDVPRAINQFKLLNKDELLKLHHEIENVLQFSLAHNEFNVLLHGDICPDNVYFLNSEVKFIDFEFGDFGNALIDGVYLRMSMPSCWCSKAVPEHIVRQMESVYRTELKTRIEAAMDDTIYTKQLVYACAYWAIRTINQIDDMDLLDHEWVCPSGLVKSDSKWEPDKNAFRPRVLSRLKSFISCTERTDHLPVLCKASASLLSNLRNKWPETGYIDFFPVFK